MASDFVPQPYGIQTRITGQHASGKKLYNVVNSLGSTSTPNQAEIEAVNDIVTTWCDHDYKYIFSSTVTIIETRTRSLAEEPGPLFVQGGLTMVGQLAADQVPVHQASRVKLTTLFTGLSHIGSFFAFCPDEAQQTGGLYTTAFATLVFTRMSVLRTDSDTNGYPWVIWSRRHRALYPIASVELNKIPAHLTSRRIDKGI